MLVVPGSGADGLARRLAEELGCQVLDYQSRKFPDGERYVRLANECGGETVCIVQSTYRDPDGLIMEYCMIADSAVGSGAKDVVGVFPYLAYLRQDERFNAGEGLSSSVYARIIESTNTSKVVVVDPHLHRLQTLDRLFNVPAFNVSAMPELARYAKERLGLQDPLVVAPDEEGFQWASKVSEVLHVPTLVAKKVRRGDVSVEIDFTDSSVEGRDVVVADDMISTGGTLASITSDLKKGKARRIFALVSHGLFSDGAYERIREAGVDGIFTTDTVPNQWGVVGAAPILARELRDILG